MARYAKREELETVNDLRRMVNELHVNGRPDIFRPGFGAEIRDYIYKMYEDPNADIIVAERDGEICGFACVTYVDRPLSPYNLPRKFCHIEEFGVDEKHRRQGVASELMDFLKSEAKQKGFDKIELDVWEFNQEAIAFYQAIGFNAYRRFLEISI